MHRGSGTTRTTGGIHRRGNTTERRYLPSRGVPVRTAAREYHGLQAEALARSGVDFLYAPTFSAVEEALGAAMAMGETGLPYVVSFVLERGGRVLDGTLLHEAIERRGRLHQPDKIMSNPDYGLMGRVTVDYVGGGRVRCSRAEGLVLVR